MWILLIPLRRRPSLFLGLEPFRHVHPFRLKPVSDLAPNLGRAVVAGGQDAGESAAKVGWDAVGPGHEACDSHQGVEVNGMM